jgi:parallel beta-helix repeat protein
MLNGIIAQTCMIFETVLLMLILLLSSPDIIFSQAPVYGLPDCINYNSITKIITIVCDTNMSNLSRDLNNKNILEKDTQGSMILNASIIVNPQAKFTINSKDTSWLKILNNKDGKPNYISISGSADIDNVKITSWNPSYKSVIYQNSNGSIPRPYIIIDRSSGFINIANSEFSSLGYNHYPSNGFVFANSISKVNLLNNSFHNLWDGVYSDSSGFIKINNNKFYNNLRHGIDTSINSHDINIFNNIAYSNSKVGIIISNNCCNVVVDNNTLHNNGQAGLMYSVNANKSIAKNNSIFYEKVGISLFSSSNNNLYDNKIISSDKGIAIAGNSSFNHIYENSIVNGNTGIYFTDFAKNNTLENNRISNVSSTIHFIDQ